MQYLEPLLKTSVQNILSHYGLSLQLVNIENEIPYSYWGTPEAGRKQNTLFAQTKTPLHSVLHEACHYVCMPAHHRTCKAIDAAGGVEEENATCYLQVLLAEHIDGYSSQLIMQDMDRWGYSFRLGSCSAWFDKDAEDVQAWLMQHKIINHNNQITWNLRN